MQGDVFAENYLMQDRCINLVDNPMYRFNRLRLFSTADPNSQNAGTAYSAFKWIEQLISFGTENYAPDAKRRLQILNVLCYWILIATIGYIFLYAYMDYNKYYPVILINSAMFLVIAAVPFVHKYHELAGSLLLIATEFVALILLTAYLGRPSGIQLQYIVGASVPFLVFGLKRLRIILSVVLIAFALHLLSWFLFNRNGAIINVEHSTLSFIYFNAAASTFIITSAVIYYSARLADEAEEKLENLLHSILPGQIVERLKAHPDEQIADHHDQASVLFADLVGFTPLSSELGIVRTTELLSQIVSKFDDIAKQLKVEKIKTIGDAYMAVAGVPSPQDDHRERLGIFALQILDIVKTVSRQHNVNLQVRIGLASGPLMAGLIGRNKFAYDVWGDTVNLASRMESQGKIDQIQVNADFMRHMYKVFHFQEAGTQNIRGVGSQATWFLLGKIDAMAGSESSRSG